MKETSIVVLVILAVIGLIALMFWALPAAPKSITKTEGEYEYRSATIEGCEYMVFVSYMGYYSMTHKGNCTNVIHRSNYESPR